MDEIVLHKIRNCIERFFGSPKMSLAKSLTKGPPEKSEVTNFKTIKRVRASGAYHFFVVVVVDVVFL